MSERLTRKEIKHDIREDQFRHSLGESWHFLRDNWRVIAAAIAGVVVLVVAVLTVQFFLERRRERADGLLGRATRVMEAAIQETGARPEDEISPTFPDEAARKARARELLVQLREEFSGTPAADLAALHLARFHYEDGEEEEARRLWEEFIREEPDHMLATTAQLSLFQLDRAAGKATEVAAQLRAALGDTGSPLPQDLVLYELGVTLEELEQPQEARSTFQRLADEYPESPYAALAQNRLREIPAAA